VVPDEYIEEYGADTFRTYLMFLGPYQEGGDFREAGITGPVQLPEPALGCARSARDLPLDPAVEQKLHATIRKVTEDLEALSYNTAIAAMMEYLNVLRRRPHSRACRCGAAGAAGGTLRTASRRGAVGADGPQGSIFDADAWPEFDPEKATLDTVEFVVQVNGKVRTRMPMNRGISEDEAREAALADANVQRFMEGKTVRKTIFVPDRLLNLVVG
jgi:leucyl-tRNA synthetase